MPEPYGTGGKTVWAFVSKSYQVEGQKGHYHQKSDDRIGLVKFQKAVVKECHRDPIFLLDIFQLSTVPLAQQNTSIFCTAL